MGPGGEVEEMTGEGTRTWGQMPALLLPSVSLAALEVTRQHSPVLLHVENHRPLYSAGTGWAGEAGPGASCSPLPWGVDDILLQRCSDPPLPFFFPFLQKRLKAAEADSKLKQVYIPT